MHDLYFVIKMRRCSITLGFVFSLFISLSNAEIAVVEERFVDLWLIEHSQKADLSSLVPNVKITTTGTGSISGQITNEFSNPIELHWVHIYDALNLTSTVLASTQTDVAGNYSFTGLEAGDYVVITGRYDDGYLHFVWQNLIAGGPRLCDLCNTNITSDSYINVSVGGNVTGIDINTQLCGVVKGFMTGANTHKMKNQYLKLLLRSNNNSNS